MNRDNSLAYIIRRNDVDAVVGAQRQHRKAREDAERLNHIKLRRFGFAAVAQNDCRAENSPRNVRQKLMHHVFAEFLGARVGIVIRARPVDRFIFAHNFILPRAGNRNRRNVRVTPQAVVILNPARQLNDFKRATQIHIQTLSFGFAVQGSGAMNQRVGGVHKLLVIVSRKSKSLASQVAAKDSDARR